MGYDQSYEIQTLVTAAYVSKNIMIVIIVVMIVHSYSDNNDIIRYDSDEVDCDDKDNKSNNHNDNSNDSNNKQI